MFEEHGPIEIMTVVAWIVAGGLALFIMVKRPRTRERWFAGGVAAACAMALMRELDMHLLLKPEHFGGWGMHFRIDWWLSASAPVLPRLLWLAAGVSVLTLLVALALKVAPRFTLLLRARDAAWLIFGAAGLALFGGYAFDDLIGRGQFMPVVYTRAFEESLELIGAVLFAVAVGLHLRLSLTMRERLARKRLAGV